MASLGVQITVLVLIVLAVLACLAIVIGFIIRAKLKQRREYIRLEIDKSITSTRPQPTGPTLAEKREDALRNVQFYLRTSKFDLVGPLWNIGSCEKKFHFQLNSPRESGLFLLTLHMKGENSKLPLTSLSLRQTIKKLLKEIKHPYILPSLKVDFLQGQKVVLLTIRPFSEKRGSIRDLVYKTKPSKGFQAKYFDETRPGHALGSKYVRQFGRQILEALDFLQINGFPYPDLHCGNVIVIDGICKLTDYEKVILGQEAHYASFSKGQNMLRDFANVLFEMSCGFEPTKKDIKYPPEKCNEQVAEIIHSIYFREQPATLDELLAHPFFDVTPKGLSEFSGEDLDLSKPEYVKLLQALTGQKTLVKKKKRPPPPEQVKKEPAKPSPAPAPASAPQAANNAPPPPPPKDLPKPPAGAPDKSSLLADIRKPNKSKLKKVTQINDRSSPSI